MFLASIITNSIHVSVVTYLNNHKGPYFVGLEFGGVWVDNPYFIAKFLLLDSLNGLFL